MSKLYYVNIEQTVGKTILLRARTANKAKNKAIARLARNQIDMSDIKPGRIRIAVINAQGRRLLNQEVA